MQLSNKIPLLILLTIFLCFQNVQAGDWTKLNSGTLSWLHSVYFVDQNSGWIVGSQGTFLKTIDGGKNWRAETKFTKDNIRDVYFADENHGWILCERDIYSSGTLSPSYIWETFDGGTNWKTVRFEGEGKERLVRIFFTKEGIGWAVGEAGTVFAMQNDKSIWKRTSVPAQTLMLNGIFTDQTHGLLVGGNGTSLFTEDGGTSWKLSAFTSKPTAKLNSVFFINQKIGWSVGAQGKIYSTINGGKLWREQISTVKEDLFDVVFLNTAEGWAIGDNGKTLHTTTAGNVWNEVPNNSKHKLERILFVGKKGWAVGFGGTIMVYDGANKEKLTQSAPPILQKRNN